MTVASLKCEARPEDDDFEPNDENAECPNENADGWPLETKVTTRHRGDREKDVCCFKRPARRKVPPRRGVSAATQGRQQTVRFAVRSAFAADVPALHATPCTGFSYVM
ncbi:hypothetical protein BH09MYX1_BH09MYX1_03860 [soil metagenome]